ncbi:MAG TPA: Flp pilus assembly protein CpaB [Chloroflexota bacterium]|nr:Flp pilus assembly protein CpaB [Chloroflexota bacterium]
MFGRRKLGIVFALILGVIAALLVWNYTQRLQAQVRTAAEQNKVVEVPVLVAAQDIPAHTSLSPALVKVIQIPQEAKLPQALTSASDVTGKVVQYPLASGEQILPDKFTVEHTDQGLAYVIPAGMRALSVSVSELNGAGGMIQPGDHVDIIATFDQGTMGKDESMLLLQNVEVLSVAQNFEGEAEQVASNAPTQPASSVLGQSVPGVGGANPTPTGVAATPTVVPLKLQPEAKTVTIAVTPEQAERVVLAQAKGSFNYALRPAKDTSVVEIPEATLSTLAGPIQKPTALIESVEISPTNAKPGDILTVKIAVKNTSDKPIQSQAPDPKYTYVQGTTYYSQKFPSQDGKFRVGINFDGQASAPFPYRWGFGGDLAPGATTTVIGYIKLTYDIKPTNFWAGLIQEPEKVLQDNEGTTLVTVLPVNTAVISVDAANVRSGPDISSSVIDKLPYGTEVPILGQTQDWYQIKLPDGRLGFVAAGWIIAPNPPGAPASH